jgi:RHS repeat-associated protein
MNMVSVLDGIETAGASDHWRTNANAENGYPISDSAHDDCDDTEDGGRESSLRAPRAKDLLDAGIGSYMLRTRYYDPATGRFTQLDTYGGDPTAPLSLHKYLYGNDNPVDGIDPSGHSSMSYLELGATLAIGGAMMALSGTYLKSCKSHALKVIGGGLLPKNGTR